MPPELKRDEKGRILPGSHGPGRPPGMQNKLTSELKAMIEGALSDVGGREYLAQQARENPVAFMSLLGKIIPRQVDIETRVTWVEMITKMAAERRERLTIEGEGQRVQ